MPDASVPTGSVPPAGGTQTRHWLSWPVPLIVSIVVMVLSLGGIAATVAYAANSGHAATPAGPGQRPGGGYTGVRPSGFPTGERPSGYPSGRPNGYGSGRPTNFPSGRPTDYPTDGSGGQYPGGVPTDVPTDFPTDVPSGQSTDGSQGGGGYGGGYGGYGNGGQGGMPNGGFQGGNRPGGLYTTAPVKATWQAWETGVVAGCGVLFLASLAWLIVSARKHGKTVRAGRPGQLPLPAPDSPQAPQQYIASAGQGLAAPPTATDVLAQQAPALAGGEESSSPIPDSPGAISPDQTDSSPGDHPAVDQDPEPGPGTESGESDR